MIPIGLRPWLPLLVAVAGGLLLANAGSAQEALRLSLAGEEAAHASAQAAATIGYYNLLLGRVAARFSGGLGLEYNDNVYLKENGAVGDFIFRPNLNTQVHLPVTQQNSLDFSLGGGYSAYWQHPERNQIYISPGTGVAFNIYAGDCVINLHDQLSISQSSYENPGTNGANSTAQLQNSAGVGVLWDLNELVVGGGYEHANYMALASGEQQPDGSSDNLYANAGVHLRPEITVGVEAGGTLIRYDGSKTASSPNAKQWNAGGFTRMQISEYMSVKVDAGYTVYAPEGTATNGITGDSADYYFDVSLTHRVNRWLNYALAAGRSTDLGFYGQPYAHYFARWSPDWNLFQKCSISTPLWWQHGAQTYSQGAVFDQYGAGLILGRQLTEKLTGSLYYQFVQEKSAQAGANYTVNIVGLNFSYQF